MKKNVLIVVITILSTLYSLYSYSQVSKVYSGIETKNVLYYKVEETVNMTFGGTTTRYTVSNLSLISKVDLGPENIRIITPIYKVENYKKKYYLETRNLNKDSDKNHEPTKLLEISIESGKIEIPENPEIKQELLALAIVKIVKIEPVVVVKEVKPKGEQPKIEEVHKVEESKEEEELKVEEPKGEKRDFVLVNVVYVYERVLEKGYKSAYMFQKVADYYYFKNQMEKAVKWYEELFAITNDIEPMYYYRFGNALLKLGKTERGNAMIEKFNELAE